MKDVGGAGCAGSSPSMMFIFDDDVVLLFVVHARTSSRVSQLQTSKLHLSLRKYTDGSPERIFEFGHGWSAAGSCGPGFGGRHRLVVQAGAMDAVATRVSSKKERILSPDSQGSPCIPRSDHPSPEYSCG